MKEKPKAGRAATLLLGAARIESEAATKRNDPLAAFDAQRAAELRDRVQQPAPEYMANIGVGRELIPASMCGENSRALQFADIVQDPHYVAVDASRNRLELAHEAGALEQSLDAAETMQAANSLERMLAHQLASAHVSAMKLSAELNRRIDYVANARGDEQERANVQATRLAGAVGRMMTSYQQGLLTLQRLRSGGRQTVVVQHLHQQVQVNGGGAVVAGKVGVRGSKSKRGKVAK